jgi:hypothetical protein
MHKGQALFNLQYTTSHLASNIKAETKSVGASLES